MTTSGTTNFSLDLQTLTEEAFERCNKELRTGYELRTARRSLNIMLIEWANKGINLWTVDQGQIPFVTGQGLYPLPLDTIDLLDHVVRQYPGTPSQTDITITRIAEPTYITIPVKLTTGRPIQMYVNRQNGTSKATTATLAANIGTTDTTIALSSAAGIPSSGFVTIGSETIGYMNVSGNSLVNCYRGQNGTTAATHLVASPITYNYLPCIYVWPTPNAPDNQYTLIYYRLRRMQDVGEGGTNDIDVPYRFIPAMVAGLAYYLSMKIPEAADRVMALKAEYDAQWQLAYEEDRDKSPVRMVPRIYGIR